MFAVAIYLSLTFCANTAEKDWDYWRDVAISIHLTQPKIQIEILWKMDGSSFVVINEMNNQMQTVNLNSWDFWMVAFCVSKGKARKL